MTKQDSLDAHRKLWGVIRAHIAETEEIVRLFLADEVDEGTLLAAVSEFPGNMHGMLVHMKSKGKLPAVLPSSMHYACEISWADGTYNCKRCAFDWRTDSHTTNCFYGTTPYTLFLRLLDRAHDWQGLALTQLGVAQHKELVTQFQTALTELMRLADEIPNVKLTDEFLKEQESSNDLRSSTQTDVAGSCRDTATA